MDLITDVITPLALLLFGGLGIASISRRIDRLESRVDARPTRPEFEELRAQMNQRFDRLEARFDDLVSDNRSIRSDITQIALAVGAQTRPQTG